MQQSCIDLLAGIGGIRFGFEQAGCKCIYACEWDKFARKTYKAFHGDTPSGDINKISIDDIPQHNILTSGFPCQPFSKAGTKSGFKDQTQGTLFFKLWRSLLEKQPEAFLLENVKHLRRHNEGNTYSVITKSLDYAGYDYCDCVINSTHYVPQNRERIFIVGFRKDLGLQLHTQAVFPDRWPKTRPTLTSILQSQSEIESQHGDKYTISEKLWQGFRNRKARNKAAGKGFGYTLIKHPFDNATTRTLTARYYKDGNEILIQQKGKLPRRLTPLEACRLQGFPAQCESFFDGTHNQPVSDTQAYKQFGNSVTVPVIRDIATRVVRILADL